MTDKTDAYLHRPGAPSGTPGGAVVEVVVHDGREYIATIIKRALKRDPTVPIGQPSPMHVDCLCGRPVPIADDLNACAACGAVYNARGYVMAR